ncbi:hypothetical protein M501DRAFT_998378 [Patellaria atrata CBS 101060]|uniref:Uncharacterized protein n=1 Tax=Patellaria atrata CBS 101060 TaxID=1346257 RepID=A0A9P4VU38_9PEZI|nr:hypothetical protein M501DRAFT_998378 [Patellaria atrata CBS 101060]
MAQGELSTGVLLLMVGHDSLVFLSISTSLMPLDFPFVLSSAQPLSIPQFQARSRSSKDTLKQLSYSLIPSHPTLHTSPSSSTPHHPLSKQAQPKTQMDPSLRYVTVKGPIATVAASNPPPSYASSIANRPAPRPANMPTQSTNQTAVAQNSSQPPSSSSEELVPTTTVRINATTTIRGSNNLIAIPPLDVTKISDMLVAALRERRENLEWNGLEDDGDVVVEMNCGICVVGEKNVVGRGVDVAPLAGGKKRKAEGESEEAPERKKSASPEAEGSASGGKSA